MNPWFMGGDCNNISGHTAGKWRSQDVNVDGQLTAKLVLTKYQATLPHT